MEKGGQKSGFSTGFFMLLVSRAERVGIWFWAWVLLSILMNLGVTEAQMASLTGDAEALMQFKKGIKGDPKGVMNGWKLSHGGTENPCSWNGVTCSRGGRVSVLDLSNAGLSGTLWVDDLISRMDELNVLVLRGNNISGVLGSNQILGTLRGCSLSILDLSENRLSGSFPLGVLSSCQKLVSLNISHNFLIGSEQATISGLGSAVQSLDLSHNLISDKSLLHGILSICKDLQHLDLSSNKLNGSIPNGILSRLVSLNLSANLFENEVPADLIMVNSSLQLLDLSNNLLSGSFSAFGNGCAPNLTVLNLSANNLTGSIPDSLGTCKALKLLNLSANKLHGAIPASMGGLSSIEQLLISGNSLKGNIPQEISNTCSTLQELNLSYNNEISGSIPLTLTSCSSLRSVDLSHNQLTGSLLNHLVGSLQSLRVLQLSFNNLTGHIPVSLASCQSLEVLDLSSNRIYGPIPPAIFAPQSSLQKLLIANNLLTGSLPREIANCKNLQTLDLSFNFLNGSIPGVLGSLPRLQDLVMWLNYFEGEIPDGICDSGSLQSLILNNNFLTGEIPESLVNCSSLIWISLSSNKLTGGIPASLGRLNRLAILQLGNNSLSGPIPPELGHCSSLIWLDLNSNMLNGSIPSALSMQSGLIVPGTVSGKLVAFIRNEGGSACRGFGGLFEVAGIRLDKLTPLLSPCENTRAYLGMTVYTFTNNGTLIYLDLSYNSLSGIIPESFGTMYYIEVLNLGHNLLSGTIPSSLGGMKEVGLLDLSHNNLHGFIPGALGGLSFLTDLDVSCNNLSGPIPSSGQLMTFPASKYQNNSGLCGLPLPPCGSHQPAGSSDSTHESSRLNHRGRAVVGSIIVGLLLATLCVVGLIVIAMRTRKEKKQEDMRDKYMDSLPTSGSGSWKLSGVLEPLSINVATFEKPLRKLTFAHLLEATNGFSADSLIGSGGFGDVYKAQLKDGTVVAIKKLIHVSGQGDREFTAEMETIGKIKHRNLVPLLGYCKVGEERLLVYEYMKWGSLEAVLHDKSKGSGSLDWPARKKIAIGSARGLAFLHHSCIPHIIHRDMKSSNVLLDENMEPRVSDFGMARLMNALDTHLSVSSLAGTPGYVPPEYYQSFRCTTKGDVYSYGVILLELLSGRRPIDPDAFGDNNLVGWMKQNVKLKRACEVFDPLLMKDKSIEMDLYHHLRIACECLDDRPWRRPNMIQVMAMFRGLQTDADADLEMFTLPEDVDLNEANLT